MKRTLREAFSAGFLAGMAVVHSQSVYKQENDFFKCWIRKNENWCTKTLKKYQEMEMEGK